MANVSQLQQIEDANGKKFSIDVSKICDINGDLGDSTSTSITDSKKNRVQQVHDIEYVDQNGNTIDSMQLLKDMSSGKTQVLALDVEMEATHSGKNHNYCVYYEDSMEKDAESFVNPFKKPMLKNHNDCSEPLGRIIQSWFGPSQLTDERSAIHLKTRVTDQDAIPKFLDGRYSTVSIGGTTGTVTCNICGKTILNDGKFKFCGHWRGETYKDQICYWGAKDIEYHEVSTVNNPADDYAQIMKVTVVTDSDDKKDSKEDTTMAGTNTDSKTTSAEDAKKSVCDIIDQLLNKSTDSSTTPEDNNKDGEKKDNTATDDKDNTNTEQAKDSQSQEDIEHIKKDLEDAQAKITTLETELADSKAALEKAEKDLEDSKEESASYQEKCMALATANKELVADSIMSKEELADDEAKDSRKKELMAMSMKDLNKLMEESTTKDSKEQQRTPAQVTNPTLANPEDNNDGDGSADTDKQTADSKNTDTVSPVDDFAKDIVGKLFK